MNKKTLAEQFKRNTAVSLIVCLFVLLWLPTLDHFFHFDRAPVPNENRAMARFPEFHATLANIREYPAGLENYFRDHFGFRNRLIRWERRWKHDLFNEALSSDVMDGKDGWLFFSGGNMPEYFQGFKKFKAEDLDNWQKLLERRRDWLAARGIKYLFVVPPDKHSIYPEYLPNWLSHLAASNRLDQFIAHMKAHSTVDVLDLRPTLLEAKKQDVIYFQTDTHWNNLGGFVAYQKLMDALRRQLPGLSEPLPRDAFDLSPEPWSGGDLTRLLGMDNPPVDKNALKMTLHPSLAKVRGHLVPELLPKKWRPTTEPWKTECENATGKAILFRDSFAVAWYPFLGYHFHDVLYIWQYEWDTALIEREKPSVVIDETLERFFNNTDPAKLMQKDSLP